jgi:hypothetical protein
MIQLMHFGLEHGWLVGWSFLKSVSSVWSSQTAAILLFGARFWLHF